MDVGDARYGEGGGQSVSRRRARREGSRGDTLRPARARPRVNRRPVPNVPHFPSLPPLIPQVRGGVRRAIGTAGLRLLGWRIEGSFPNRPKIVIIVAPHTSNWDFVIGFLAYLALQLSATWFGKHTLFMWPFGLVLRHFGGIPVVRRQSASVVELYVAEFNRRDSMTLALAPEGTRRRVSEWKTGFYHIALGAGAVIVPVVLDYRARRVRIRPIVVPTGDIERDLVALRSPFQSAVARYPDKYHDV